MNKNKKLQSAIFARICEGCNYNKTILSKNPILYSLSVAHIQSKDMPQMKARRQVVPNWNPFFDKSLPAKGPHAIRKPRAVKAII